MNQQFVRKAHRWLGIVAIAQLFIWTGSGLFFAMIPIDDIRGSHLLEQAAVFRLAHVKLVSPSFLVGRYPELSTVNLNQVRIGQRLNTPVYTIKAGDSRWVFNAETAEKLDPLTELEVSLIASSATNLSVRSATWLTDVAPGSEYRGGELPAWQVEMEGGDHVQLYITAYSGQIEAVRTAKWRIYDLLWSLHIMDYVDRDNFNSWLLRGFALLGVITVLSGIALFFISSVRTGRRGEQDVGDRRVAQETTSRP